MTDRRPTQLLVLTPVETALTKEPVVRAVCGHDCVPSPQAQVALKSPDMDTTVICNRDKCIDNLVDGKFPGAEAKPNPPMNVGFDHP